MKDTIKSIDKDEDKSKKIKIKIVIILCSVLVGVFAIWNIAWFAFVNSVYKPLADKISVDNLGYHSMVADDNYRYSVFMPSYLSFTSNLSVHENTPINEQSDSHSVSLIIWPKLFGGYEYGVSLTVPKSEGKDELSFSSYNFMFDEHMNPLDELNEYEKEVLEEYKDEIKELYNKVYRMWGIGDTYE